MPEFKRTLIIHDDEHFHAALAFSQENVKDPHQGLESKIFYLLTGHYGGADTLHLTKDFVPHSFNFQLRRGSQPGLSGGIICHGQGEETFSVELCPKPGIHYSIHT